MYVCNQVVTQNQNLNRERCNPLQIWQWRVKPTRIYLCYDVHHYNMSRLPQVVFQLLGPCVVALTAVAWHICARALSQWWRQRCACSPCFSLNHDLRAMPDHHSIPMDTLPAKDSKSEESESTDTKKQQPDVKEESCMLGKTPTPMWVPSAKDDARKYPWFLWLTYHSNLSITVTDMRRRPVHGHGWISMKIYPLFHSAISPRFRIPGMNTHRVYFQIGRKSKWNAARCWRLAQRERAPSSRWTCWKTARLVVPSHEWQRLPRANRARVSFGIWYIAPWVHFPTLASIEKWRLQRDENLRVRALFVKNMTKQVLQMLGQRCVHRSSKLTNARHCTDMRLNPSSFRLRRTGYPQDTRRIWNQNKAIVRTLLLFINHWLRYSDLLQTSLSSFHSFVWLTGRSQAQCHHRKRVTLVC